MVAHCKCCGEEMIGDNDHNCPHTRMKKLESALRGLLEVTYPGGYDVMCAIKAAHAALKGEENR
jgi:hypothetical protein